MRTSGGGPRHLYFYFVFKAPHVIFKDRQGWEPGPKEDGRQSRST